MVEERIRAAELEMNRMVSAAMFPVFIGPPNRPPPPPSAWVRFRRRVQAVWLSVREWIAEKVLRVDVDRGEW